MRILIIPKNKSPQILVGKILCLFSSAFGKTNTEIPNSSLHSDQINALNKTSDNLTKGTQNTVGDITAEAKSLMEDAYATVYEKGPEVLDQAADVTPMSGIAVGGGFLSFGQAEIGLPIIGGSGIVSFTISTASSVLCGIDYFFNGGQDRFDRVSEKIIKLGIGAAFGGAIAKSISTVKSFTIQKFPGVIF